VLPVFLPGCLGCREKEPINREAEKACPVTRNKIDTTENPQYIREFPLAVTLTILVVQGSNVQERFERIVHQAQLVDL
jgi:hypothetical protein